MRNVPDTKMNTDFSDTTPNILGSSIIFVNTGAVTKHVSYGSGNITWDAGQPGFETVATPIRSLIVIGGDIFIDEAILPATEWSSRVLIALKNEAGVGGNVYLKGGVTKIKASIIAEWSVLSGYFPSASSTGANLYNTTASGLFALPWAQLYIKWSVISHNTIGGAYGKTSGYVCPYIEPNCTSSKAIKYDFNYFRDFQKTDSGAVLFRGYDNDTYDDYSIIIEYDPNLIADPPPGIAEIK